MTWNQVRWSEPKQRSGFKSTEHTIYIYICVPLILYFCMSFMHGQTSHRRRLKLCMWPRPMGAGDIGHMRSASAASEAVSWFGAPGPSVLREAPSEASHMSDLVFCAKRRAKRATLRGLRGCQLICAISSVKKSQKEAIFEVWTQVTTCSVTWGRLRLRPPSDLRSHPRPKISPLEIILIS